MPGFFAGVGYQAGEGNALWLISWGHRLLGDFGSALTAINAALQIARDTSGQVAEAHWLTEAARVHLASGDAVEALRCSRAAVSIQRRIGDRSREAMALDCMGQALLARGDTEEAAVFQQQAVRMHRELGDAWNEAQAMVHLADCEAALGRDDTSREDAARAMELLQRFTDDQATALRASLRARLG